MSRQRLYAIAILACTATAVCAKLPPLNDEAKAKAAEATARTAWGDKVSAFQLCKAQDRVAARYMSDAKKAGKDVKPAAATQCADPGPFSYTPPPLEAAGAHSPAPTAAGPPSTSATQAQQQGSPKK